MTEPKYCCSFISQFKTMSIVSINKLLKATETEDGDSKAFFYLETKWEDNEIRLRLQDSQSGKCYQGNLTNQNLKEAAEELSESFNTYYEECRLALTTYMALPGYTYKVDEDEPAFKVWKCQDDSVPMLYLEIPLETIRNHYEIFDSAIGQLQSNSKSLTERVEKAHKFDKNSRELLEDYRLCVEEKNQLERNLLRKVSVLINAKKQKICELEERLAKYEDMEIGADNDDGNIDIEEDDEEDQPQSSRKRRPLLVESESEDDDDDDAFNANTEPLTLPQ